MLASKHRFHRRNHVNRVYKQGSSVRQGALSLKYRVAEGGSHTKFAVVVSKKVAKNAVDRNRIRRRIFELLRNNKNTVPDGFEGVVGVFDASVADLPHKELEKHVRDLLAKAK